MTTTTSSQQAKFGIQYGYAPGADPENLHCVLCDFDLSDGEVAAMFGIVLDGHGTGRICRDCAETAAPSGSVVADFVEALEALDLALTHADPADRTPMLGMATQALTWIITAHQAEEAL